MTRFDWIFFSLALAVEVVISVLLAAQRAWIPMAFVLAFGVIPVANVAKRSRRR